MSLSLKHNKYADWPYILWEMDAPMHEVAKFKNIGHAAAFIRLIQPVACQHEDTYRGIYQLGITKIRKRGNRQWVQKPKIVEVADGGMMFCRKCPAVKLSRFGITGKWHEDIEAFLKHR